MIRSRIFRVIVICVALGGCAGVQRSCTSWTARNIGSDWVVVQYDYNMNPKMCWKLSNVSVANEADSDGIHWYDSNTSAMRHIGGWYNYAQVHSMNFADAARRLGVDSAKCEDGVYR
jgi:hypothetical protein